jgi:hypothetical protein
VDKCPNKDYTIEFDKDKHKGNESYTLDSVEDIQKEIFENGPVIASLIVYEDFIGRD